jgi:hypothetical protein
MEILKFITEVEKDFLKENPINDCIELPEDTDMGTLCNILKSKNTNADLRKTAFKMLERKFPNENISFRGSFVELSYSEIMNSPFKKNILLSDQVICRLPLEDILRVYFDENLKLRHFKLLKCKIFSHPKEMVLDVIKKLNKEKHDLYDVLLNYYNPEKNKIDSLKKLTHVSDEELACEIYAGVSHESWLSGWDKKIEKIKDDVIRMINSLNEDDNHIKKLSDYSDIILLILKEKNINIYIPQLYPTNYYWLMSEDELKEYLNVLSNYKENPYYHKNLEKLLKEECII